MELFSAKNIEKRYAAHVALDDVSITVHKNTVFGLLGPNGAGKTSLRRIINQITAPDKGELFFEGKKMTVFQCGTNWIFARRKRLVSKDGGWRTSTIPGAIKRSASMHPGNLNATKPIVQSVILYVLRLWVNKPVAMNEGLIGPVKVILPLGMLNPDFSSKKLPAVVGGNTEVSQRLTDTWLKALGIVACSQGTMNNFLFGNERFGFYETICGGTGAGPTFNGTNAIHSHMTNTRITDPEILELRYPVRLERFLIRKNTGGIEVNGKEGMAFFGKLKSCFLRVNRSSCAAAMIVPSLMSAAAES